MNVIEVEGLTKRYGRDRGVEGLTFDVHRGESFGFLGPNGAGKTTTIRTLLDLIRPTSGSVRVFGSDPHRHGAIVTSAPAVAVPPVPRTRSVGPSSQRREHGVLAAITVVAFSAAWVSFERRDLRA